jgi:hypothetical protein
MIDKTTDGYSVTDDQVEGLLRNLCAYALTEPEALQRYVELTNQQVLFEGVVNAIRRERGRALGDLAVGGEPITAIAKRARLATPQQVRLLITGAGLRLPKSRTSPKPRRAATLQPRLGTGPHPPSNANNPAKAIDTTVAPDRAPGHGDERTLTAEERIVLGLAPSGLITRSTPRDHATKRTSAGARRP